MESNHGLVVCVCVYIHSDEAIHHITGVIICGSDSQIVCVSIYYYTCTT